MQKKQVQIVISLLVMIIQACSSLPATQTVASLPSTPSPTVTNTAMPTSTPTVTPTPTATDVPAWVTNFAEPILIAIKDREPDFQDDFSIDTEKWFRDFDYNKYLTIDEGVMRLQGDYHISNYYFLYKPNIVLQVDILDPVIAPVRVDLSSLYEPIGVLQLESKHEWIVWDEQYKISSTGKYASDGEKTRILIIIKGARAVYYINGDPVAYFENPKLANDRENQRAFVCCRDGNVCYFDNVKVWNLDNIPNSP